MYVMRLEFWSSAPLPRVLRYQDSGMPDFDVQLYQSLPTHIPSGLDDAAGLPTLIALFAFEILQMLILDLLAGSVRSGN